jgi:hypothetical protein
MDIILFQSVEVSGAIAEQGFINTAPDPLRSPWGTLIVALRVHSFFTQLEKISDA